MKKEIIITEAEREQSRKNIAEKEEKRDMVYEQNKNKPVLDDYYKWCSENFIDAMEKDIEIATILLKNHASRLQVLILTGLTAECVASIEEDIQDKEYDTMKEYITESMRNIKDLVKALKLSKADFDAIKADALKY